MVNNIRNNTISEISARISLNALNEIENTEIIKYKKFILIQKELLSLFNKLLDAILTDKALMSSNKNGNENGNDKTLMSSNEDNGNKAMNQNNNDIIKGLNDDLDKINDESKSYEDQIELIKKQKI